MARKVCLAGFAQITREWANQQPDEVEIWGMNEGHTFLRRSPTRWFQVHPPLWNQRVIDKNKWPSGNYGRHPAHVAWMAEQTCPVYMQEPDPRIPTAVKYPLDEIVDRYGRYLTSTIAYMLALLLYEHQSAKWWKPWTWKSKVESFTLAGIEMTIGTEYMFQKPCVEYLIGRLQGAGVKFIQPPTGTSIINGMLYAVDHDSPILEGELEPVWAGDKLGGKSVPIVKMAEDEELPKETVKA